MKGTKVNENVKLVQGKISGEYNDETDSEPRLWKDHEKGRGDETIRQREEPGCLGTAGGRRGGRQLRRMKTSMAVAQKGSIAWHPYRLEQRKYQPCTATWDLQMPLAFTSGNSKLEAWYEQVLSCSR